MAKILNLNHHAPNTQEELRFLPPAEGYDHIYERMLRSPTAMLD
jgi:hypothetical protein